MAKLVLHVGTHKTGTSAFQFLMHSNRARLAKRGLVYPDFGKGPNHHGLLAEWIPALGTNFAIAGGAEAALAALNRAHAKSDATVILSSEEFTRGTLARRVDFRVLRQRLSAFSRIEVLCSLRSQPGFVQSCFMQIRSKVRMSNWDQFYRKTLLTGYASGLFVDFNALDDHLLTGFAPEEITYFDYDAQRRLPGGTPAALLAHLGYHDSIDDLEWYRGGEINTSGSPLAAWVAASIAETGQPDERLTGIVNAAFNTSFDPGRATTLYTRPQLERAIKTFAPLNEAFRNRLTGRGAAAPALDLRMFGDKMLYREDLRSPFWLDLAKRLNANPVALPSA